MQDEDPSFVLLLRNAGVPNGSSYSPDLRSLLNQIRRHRESDTSCLPAEGYEGRMRFTAATATDFEGGVTAR